MTTVIINIPEKIEFQPEDLIEESQIPLLPASKINRGIFRDDQIPASVARVREVQQMIGTALDGNSEAGHTHPIATETTSGFMSAVDKAKLDGLSETGGNPIDSIADVPGLVEALQQRTMVGHAHYLSDIADLSSTLTGKANVEHDHTIADVQNLDTVLNNIATDIALLTAAQLNPQLLTYTVSQSAVDAGHTGTYSNLTDDDRTTGAATPNAQSWIKADLGSLQQVNRLCLAGGELSGWDSNVSSYINGAIVEVSINDLDWTPLFTISGVTNSRESVFLISSPPIRYLRVFRGGYLGTTTFKLLG